MSVGPAIAFLRLPPLQPVTTTPRLAALEARIELLAGRSPTFVSTFGLELRAATVMAMGAEPSARLALQRLLSRPAAEAILLHAWPQLMRPGLDLESMQKIASGLAAKPLTIAKGRMRTTAGRNGEFTVYAPPEQRNELSGCLTEARAAAIDHPLASALVVFALTILAHPLTDGNGRLARALVHGTLAQGGLVRVPVLPLAPAFYARADVVRTALKELSRTGDWFAAVESLSEILSLACALAEETEKLVSSVQAHSTRNEQAAAETR